ncbi:Rieske 2Fe-2S domain-containing protein [Gordonia sp. NPDC127522]|uniref:Rieske 2Fe-2S domain-containing protein n=1 Tax=Gordonia sp. NPDC127522 TaxID=3345390 RepID=UPI003635C32D
MRGKDMSIRAFYNSCLHRGRMLREESGPAGNDLRCPFHGFCWNLDGSLKSMTCEWDFPHVDKDEMFDSMVDARTDEDPMVGLPDGVTAREMSGLLAREGIRDVMGDVNADTVSDAEPLDSIYYTVFPNVDHGRLPAREVGGRGSRLIPRRR